MKKFFILVLFLVNSFYLSSQASSGCMVGTRIYTYQLGVANFWGTMYNVYSNNPNNSYPVNWNSQIVSCDNVEIGNVVNVGPACWISSSVPPQNSSAGRQEGSMVNYTKCAGTSGTNLPLDDYIWVLLIAIAAIGSRYILNSKLRATNP